MAARRAAGIAVDGDAVSLGALTTYTEIRRSALCREHLPALVEAAATIGAAQIQNRGTLGGNIVNASPAGDTLPVLLAADAVVRAGRARGERTVRPNEFWPAYRHDGARPRRAAPAHPDPARRRSRDAVPQGRDAPGPVDQQGRDGARLARRQRAPPRRAWSDVRVALGSVAATPIRASRTEAALEGRPPTPETADRPPRRSQPSSIRSTTSARRPSIGGSSPRASSTASSARPAAGDRDRFGRSTLDLRSMARRHRAGRLRRGRRAALRGRARLPRTPGDGAAVRIGRGFFDTRPRDRPRDAGRGEDRAHRCASAARRAAGGVSALSFGEQGYDASGTERAAADEADASPPSWTGSTTRTRPFRVPLLCLRRRSVARGAAPRDDAPRSTADRDAELDRALDAVVDIARDRYATLTAASAEDGVIELGRTATARRRSALSASPRTRRRPRPRPDRGDRPRGRFHGRPHRRRQRQRHRHRHDEEHGLRVRQGSSRRRDRGLRPGPGRAFPRRAPGRIATVNIRAHHWAAIDVGGQPAPGCVIRGGEGTRVATVSATRGGDRSRPASRT